MSGDNDADTKRGQIIVVLWGLVIAGVLLAAVTLERCESHRAGSQHSDVFEEQLRGQ